MTESATKRPLIARYAGLPLVRQSVQSPSNQRAGKLLAALLLIREAGFPAFRIAGTQSIWLAVKPESRNYGIPHCRHSVNLACRETGEPELRRIVMPYYRVSGFAVRRLAALTGSRHSG